LSTFIYYRNLILSAICIIGGTALAWAHLTQENGGFPYLEQLTETSGQVDWVQSYDYGIRFGLVDSDKNFNYMSKMDGQGIVYDSLVNSGGKTVRILFKNSEPNSPIYTDKKYFSVFEIEVGDRMIRSLAESEDAWRSDNFFAPFLIVFFVFGGVYIGNKTIKERRNA
jgi:hypothetical protein